MSATMTTTQTYRPTTTTTTTTLSYPMATACVACPQCGFDLPPVDATQAALLDAQKQIDDLHSQVRLLNQKAAAAVDRWADYEDELGRLRAQVAAHKQQDERKDDAVAAAPTPPPPASPSRGSFLATGAANRISALLSPRKSTPNLQQPPSANPTSPSPSPSPSASPIPPPPDTPSTADLLAALSREQTLRRAAEGKLNDTSREVEELSVTLFEQANEMVATERRARAKLEERVELLERRDVEKRARLERLEQAMGRIERVRALLDETGG